MDSVQTAELDRFAVEDFYPGAQPVTTTGSRIRQYRQASGWTQEALAEKVGTYKATVCDWERGAHAPSTASIRRLAMAFNVHPALLLTWE